MWLDGGGRNREHLGALSFRGPRTHVWLQGLEKGVGKVPLPTPPPQWVKTQKAVLPKWGGPNKRDIGGA